MFMLKGYIYTKDLSKLLVYLRNFENSQRRNYHLSCRKPTDFCISPDNWRHPSFFKPPNTPPSTNPYEDHCWQTTWLQLFVAWLHVEGHSLLYGQGLWEVLERFLAGQWRQEVRLSFDNDSPETVLTRHPLHPRAGLASTRLLYSAQVLLLKILKVN